MDAQDILKTLNNLEKSLQNVESARQQVINTVDAYEGAKSQLHALAEEFSTVSAELKNVYTAINKNASSLDMTLQKKFEEVFKSITSRTQELQNSVTNIQSAFKVACEQSTESIEGSVDNCILKFCNEIDTAIVNFSKKAKLETDGIAAALAGFKSSALQMQKEFSLSISAAAGDHKATQEKIASDFGKSVSNHISSFKSLSTELQSRIDKYEEINLTLEIKVDQTFDLVKKESESLASAIHKLQANQKYEHDDLSKRFDTIDSEQAEVITSISDFKNRLDYASSHIVQNQTTIIASTEKRLVDEINSVKEELVSSKKLTFLCLIAIAISLVLNIIVLTK